MDSGPVCPFASLPARFVCCCLPKRAAGLALMLSYKLMHPLVREYYPNLPTWGVIKSLRRVLRRVSLTLIRNRTKIPCIVNPWASRWVVDCVGRRLAGARLLGVGQRVCLWLAGRRCVHAWRGAGVPAQLLSGMRPLPICGGLRETADLRLPGRRGALAWNGASMPAYGFRARERIPACGAEQAQPDARRFVDVWKTARGGLCHGR